MAGLMAASLAGLRVASSERRWAELMAEHWVDNLAELKVERWVVSLVAPTVAMWVMTTAAG